MESIVNRKRFVKKIRGEKRKMGEKIFSTIKHTLSSLKWIHNHNFATIYGEFANAIKHFPA